jgi:hypothetical protein
MSQPHRSDALVRFREKISALPMRFRNGDALRDASDRPLPVRGWMVPFRHNRHPEPWVLAIYPLVS